MRKRSSWVYFCTFDNRRRYVTTLKCNRSALVSNCNSSLRRQIAIRYLSAICVCWPVFENHPRSWPRIQFKTKFDIHSERSKKFIMTDATLTTNHCVIGNTAVFKEYMISKYKLQNFVRSV